MQTNLFRYLATVVRHTVELHGRDAHSLGEPWVKPALEEMSYAHIFGLALHEQHKLHERASRSPALNSLPKLYSFSQRLSSSGSSLNRRVSPSTHSATVVVGIQSAGKASRNSAECVVRTTVECSEADAASSAIIGNIRG